jgi:hypothetical protein
MCIFILSTSFVRNVSHSNKNWAKYDEKYILFFMYSTRYSRQILMTLQFSQQIFEKYWNVKIHENLSSWSRVAPCAQTVRQKKTDRHEEDNIRFRNFAEVSKIKYGVIN